MKCRNISEMLFKNWNSYWKRWLNTGSNFIASVVFSPYSFSCPLSVTLFTNAPGCEEQGFFSNGFTWICFASILPKQWSAWVLAEESLCVVVWLHQGRTPTPCRAVGVCCWTAHPSHTSSPLWGDAPESTRQSGHGILLGLLPLLTPAPCCVWWEYQLQSTCSAQRVPHFWQSPGAHFSML